MINGPDAGNVYRIEKPRVTIGRTGADRDHERQRRVAAARGRRIRDLTWVPLHDLGSTNGTLVDEQKITGPVELPNQGEFQVGGTTIMLIVTDEM